MSDNSKPQGLSSRAIYPFLIGLLSGALIVLLIMAGAGVFSDKPTTQQAEGNSKVATSQNSPEQKPEKQPDKPQTISTDRRIEGDPMALGSVDAPVAIVEYADHRCPFCSLFGAKIFQQIKENYIDKGYVRFEYRDMPVFGPQSVQAAISARAAGKQNKFWEYSLALSENGVAEGGHPDLPRERLIKFAEQIGIPDMAKFKADLDDPKLAQETQQDFAEGQKLGISSVPAFLVGGTGILGAQEYKTFKQLIDQKLTEAGVEPPK